MKSGATNLQPLIFTDLDGSLLDHHNYDFSPAVPLLEQLEKAGVPVIPATSKTAAEILELRGQLKNRHPFIAENGAAIYIPANYFAEVSLQTVENNDFLVIEQSASRQHWLEILDSVAEEFSGEFRCFQQAGVEGIMEMTGLDRKAAAQANQREYSEPVAWLGDPERKSHFINRLETAGASVLQGGRFISIAGNCDKGKALQLLQGEYQRNGSGNRLVSLAIGDSNNDVAMLEAADYALIIRSPNHPPPKLQREHGVSISSLTGPTGWRDGVENWLRKLIPSSTF